VLWKLERGRNAERAGQFDVASLEYGRVLELLRQADPELAAVVRDAEDGLQRVRPAAGARAPQL
jgi:hypothetical protein